MIEQEIASFQELFGAAHRASGLSYLLYPIYRLGKSGVPNRFGETLPDGRGSVTALILRGLLLTPFHQAPPEAQNYSETAPRRDYALAALGTS
jgi:hypothetical protein